jgi:hypothetical protein
MVKLANYSTILINIAQNISLLAATPVESCEGSISVHNQLKRSLRPNQHSTLGVFANVALAISLCLSFCAPDGAQAVRVHANGQFGSGLLRSRDRECFVVTAGHLVDNVPSVTIETLERRQGPGSVRKAYAGNDLALIQLDQNAAGFCSTQQWPRPGGDVTSLLQGASGQGKLVRIENGSTVQIAVLITQFDEGQFITVRSLNSEQTIARGWSGSPLFVGNSLVGMLVSVGSDGTGKVYRIDYITTLIAPFWATDGGPPDEVVVAVQSPEFRRAFLTILEAVISRSPLRAIRGDYDSRDTTDDYSIVAYYSLVGLPGAVGSGEVDQFKAEKYPYKVAYDFGTARSDPAGQARFEALVDAIRQCIPDDWLKQTLNHGHNYDDLFEAKKSAQGPTVQVKRAFGKLTLALAAPGKGYLLE